MQDGLSWLSLDLMKMPEISWSRTSSFSVLVTSSLWQSWNKVTKKYFSKLISASLIARSPAIFLKNDSEFCRSYCMTLTYRFVDYIWIHNHDQFDLFVVQSRASKVYLGRGRLFVGKVQCHYERLSGVYQLHDSQFTYESFYEILGNSFLLE